MREWHWGGWDSQTNEARAQSWLSLPRLPREPAAASILLSGLLPDITAERCGDPGAGHFPDPGTLKLLLAFDWLHGAGSICPFGLVKIPEIPSQR